MSEALGTDARGLIDEAAGGDDPSVADRERMRARLALALVATTGGFVVAGATKAVVGGVGTGTVGTAGTVGALGTVGAAATVGLGVKIALGAVVVATLAGAGGLAVSRSTARAPARASSAVPAPGAVAAASVAPAAPAAPAVLGAPATTELDAPAAAAAVATSAASAASAASAPAAVAAASAAAPSPRAIASPPDVAEELVLLREARSALKAGDPDRSLHLLAEHARRFPHGGLAEEREAARAVASCARVDSGGTVAEARGAVSRFFRAYPRSLHASRVHSACDALGAADAVGGDDTR